MTTVDICTICNKRTAQPWGACDVCYDSTKPMLDSITWTKHGGIEIDFNKLAKVVNRTPEQVRQDFENARPKPSAK